MKKVLIVDDDQGFILSLQDMCKDHVNKFQVITAGNGKEALEAIQKEDIQLVVTDLKMPEMDGFELISQLSRRNKIIPVIAMTAFGTPEMEDRLMNMGAFQYIEKPIDFNTLLQKIEDGLAAGTKGHVSGISLPSFLQLLELDHKTCTLTAKSGSRVGMLFFDNGTLINAYTEPLEGLDAAFEIISWEQAEIEIYNFCQNKRKTIEVPLGFVLIESARISDERQEKGKQAATAGPKPAAPGAADDDLAQLDNLDFATSKPAAASAPGPAEKKGDDKSLEGLLNATAGVNRMVLVSNDGTVLAQKNIDNKEFKPFVTYVTVAAEKMRHILGTAALPKHIILSQERGEKLLIIPGSAVSVGIEVSPDISPAKIAASIGPAMADAQTN